MTDENLNKDGNVGTENNVSDTGVKRREGRRRNYNSLLILLEVYFFTYQILF